jgi:hypothetical protein
MQARTLTLALAVALGPVATTAATPTPADPAKPAPTTGRLALPGAPPDYELRESRPISAPAGTVTRATVRCKLGGSLEHALGGGALVVSTSPQVSLAGDYPPLDAVSWSVSVVNASASVTSFRAYAICAHDALDDNGETGGWTVPPHSAAANQSGIGGGCNMDVGGPNDQGKSLEVLLHETRPLTAATWTFAVDNNTGATRHYTLLDECSLIPGAHIIHGPLVSNPPGSQTQVTVTCDTGVPLAGGIGASSSSPLVSVNSSAPIDGGWQAYENNASAQADTIRAWVICSGS